MYSGWYIVIVILVLNFILFIFDLISEIKKDKDGAIIKHYKENGLTWGNRKALTYETDISDWFFDDDDIPRCKKCNAEALYCKASILQGSAEMYAYRLSEYCPKCGAKMIEDDLKEDIK